MRKHKASNSPNAGGDTSGNLQIVSKGVETAPTPIITVTTPSKGACVLPPPKKVIFIKGIVKIAGHNFI